MSSMTKLSKALMDRNRMRLLIPFFALVVVCPLLWGQIEYREVEAKATGSSLQEAINNGLVEAIGRVNGKSIDAKNQLDQLSQITTINGNRSRYSEKEIQRAYSEATKGVVESYQVISEIQISQSKWEVVVKANIAKYKKSQTSNRRRVALMPFHCSELAFWINDQAVDKERINRILGQELVSQLVQTRKFTVLDRDYIQEIVSEKNIIISGNAPLEEMAKLGNDLVADYIFVGSIENLKFKTNEIQMQTSGKIAKLAEGIIEVSYRIIDVPTKQIKFSDFARIRINPEDLSRVDNGYNVQSPESAICLIAANKISNKIINAIYPMLIVAVQGNIVSLNQGGDLIKIGDKYSVFKYGDRIFDPYTKESLGRNESYIGLVEIIRVSSKLSQARIISSEVSFSEVFSPKTLVCRIQEESKSPASKKMLEIERKREDRQKSRDADW